MANELNELIQAMIEEGGTDSVEQLYNDYKNLSEDFWKYLLNYMKGKQPTLISQSELTSENADDNQQSIFGYINKYSDIDGQVNDFWSKLIENYYQPSNLDYNSNTGVKTNGYFWNESVSKAIAHYLLNFDTNTIKAKELEDFYNLYSNKTLSEEDIEKFKAGKYDFDLDNISFQNGIKVTEDGEGLYHFHISDILNADAGLNLKDNNEVDPKAPPWVRPQYNIDGELYKNVRGVDKIQSVLNSAKEMQYTVSQGSEETPHWLRLLMPKYLRYVEVEDLNRNFWVIGQTIAAISAYLFGDDAPINEALKNLLNEIAQLWQNIMYLWATMAVLSQKDKVESVHTEVVILPNDELQPLLKYDNFGSTATTNWDEIIKRVSNYPDSYPKNHLILLPCIKSNNYKHNFYSKETYPGILFYDRNNNVWRKADFDSMIIVDAEDYKDRIYGIREEEDVYQYYYPLSDTPMTNKQSIFYGLLDVVPDIKVTHSGDIFQIKIKFNIYDRTDQILNNNMTLVASYTINNNNELNIFNIPFYGENYSVPATLETFTPVTNPTLTIKEQEISKGFYQGELVSIMNKVIGIAYEVKYESIGVLPAFYMNQNTDLQTSNRRNSGGGATVLWNPNIEDESDPFYKKGLKNLIYRNFSNTFKNNGYDRQSFIQYLSTNGLKLALQSFYDAQVDNVNNLYILEYLSSSTKDLTKEEVYYTEYDNWFLNVVFPIIDNEVSNFSVSNTVSNGVTLVSNIMNSISEKYDNSTDDYSYKLNKFFLGVFLIAFFSARSSQDLYEEGNTADSSLFYFDNNCEYGEGLGVPIQLQDKLMLYYLNEEYTKANQFTALYVQRDGGQYQNFPFYTRAHWVLIDSNGEIFNENSDVSTLKPVLLNWSGCYPQGATASQALVSDNEGKFYNKNTGIEMTDIDDLDNVRTYYPKYFNFLGDEIIANNTSLVSHQLLYDNQVNVYYQKDWGQDIWTDTQYLLLTKYGDALESNNWCITIIKAHYSSNGIRYCWNDDVTKPTYAECIGAYNYPIRKISLVQQELTNYEQIKKQGNYNEVGPNASELYNNTLAEINAFERYQQKGLDWFTSILDDENYILNQTIYLQVAIDVLRYDGEYARITFKRDQNPESSHYLEWVQTSIVGDFEHIRNQYYVISNNIKGKDFERSFSGGEEPKILHFGLGSNPREGLSDQPDNIITKTNPITTAPYPHPEWGLDVE